MSDVKERAIRETEKHFAKQVFKDSLPYDRIMIGDDFGLEDRAYMDSQDMPGIGTGDYYVLRLGPVGYPDATSSSGIYGGTRMVKTVFIHELTHVWQSYRGISVLAASILSQAVSGLLTWDMSNAYDYSPGSDWCFYNVEQQAKIVEHWFTNGMKSSDERFQYIRDNIRKGKTHPDSCVHKSLAL